MKNLGIKGFNVIMIVTTIGAVSKVKNLGILEIKKLIILMIAASIAIVIGKLLDRILAVFIESCREDLYKKLHDKGEGNPDYIDRMELELEELNQKLDNLVDMKEYHTTKGIMLTQKQLELLDDQIQYMEEYALTLMARIREERIMIEKERDLGKRILKEKNLK